MSENRKMSSPYAVLDNRPIDQWKVTELKEELKKRKLMTKGLKEDLVKRLDEAVRTENAQAMRNTDKGFDSVPQPEVQSKNSVTFPSLVETIDSMDNGGKKIERLASDNDGDRNERVILDGLENIDSVNEKADTDVAKDVVDDGFGSLAKESVPIGDLMGSTVLTGAEVLQVAQQISEETTIIASESMGSEILLSGQEVQNSEIQDKCGVSDLLQDSEDSKPAHEEAKLNSSDVNCQVVEVSQVIYDSISIDTISITEKNELKDNVIADDVKLEVDFKPEMVQLSSSNIALYDDDLQSVDINESHADTVIVEEKDANQDENTDIGIKNDSGDVGSPEKLNLDRSSGDDSMEEDAPECKQIDSKFSHEISDKSEKVEVPVVKDDAPLDAMVEDMPVVKVVNVESQNGLAAASVKRKLHEEEAAGNTEITKKQRRWNAENLTVPEPLSGNVSASNTPKDAFQRTMKRSFSRSNSAVSDDTPKERVVPPSPKTPTNSLKIDRFLRPFTLKAVQELLGKTGSITSFWMDHIKTHCYVTYSSVEEATETRNAVYNLQWPTNGGRLLVAEFVDPQEVKIRLEAPPSPVIPVSNTPALPPSPAAPVQPPQPSPRLQVQRQHLPPPPPLSNPPPAREQLLPPPPPLPERVDLPILTLDDLFRKTKATPLIYYLPLSDEQVAAKLKAQGKTTTQ